MIFQYPSGVGSEVMADLKYFLHNFPDFFRRDDSKERFRKHPNIKECNSGIYVIFECTLGPKVHD